MDEILETDVLVVGGGAAGAIAALRARENNVEVMLLMKGPGCTKDGLKGFNVAIGDADSRDNPDVHFDDTLNGGVLLNNQRLVRILVDEIVPIFEELKEAGVRFEKENGSYAQLLAIGCKYPRCVFYNEIMGREILRHFFKENKRRGVEVMPDIMVAKLLARKGAVVGVCGFDLANKRIISIKSKATILATGGLGQIYPLSTNPKDVTGDGYALAYEAGAKLMDMEFVQFEPFVTVYPEKCRGVLLPTPFIRNGAVLYNADDNQFMYCYVNGEEKPLNKYLFSRAIFMEIRDGRGTNHGGVYFDATCVDNKLFEAFPATLRRFEAAGVSLSETAVEVAPACHYMMGGIEVNERCESNVSGLFAAGEVVGGIHGANRIAGNSGSDILVFGARAGKYASELAKSKGPVPLEKNTIEIQCSSLLRGSPKQKEPISYPDLVIELQKNMWKGAGVVREKRILMMVLRNLKEMRSEDLLQLPSEEFDDLVKASEARNMVLTSEIILRSALFRKESRGSHFRSDFPKRNDKQWLVNVTVNKGKSKMNLSTKPIVKI